MINLVRGSFLAVLLSAGTIGLAVSGLSGSDRAIERSFSHALAGTMSGPGLAVDTGPVTFDPANLHLSRSDIGFGTRSGTPLDAGLATGAGARLVVGDRLTLTQKNGGSVSYEVVEVRPLETGAQAGAQTGGSEPRLSMVTAIARSESPARTVRFLIEADGEAAVAVPAKPHAL